MSYVRFAPDSQVYVYESLSGIECCGCAFGGWFCAETTDEMVAHLHEHRAAGHRVPDRAFEALSEDDG